MKTITLILLACLAIAQCAVEEGDLFEGDIDLSPDQRAALEEQRNKKHGFASINSFHWMTNGKPDIIKYYINPLVGGASNAIALAIGDYEKYTCLRFSKQSIKPQGPHLYFTTGTGCSSPVGRLDKGNDIKLARGCWHKGTVIHEMAHSLGFFHEQSRPDRDQHVTIVYANIKSGKSNNFEEYRTNRVDSLGTPYDYDSVMHYGGTYFTKNGKLTIKTNDPSKQSTIGQREGFSKTDVKQLNLLYCSNRPPPTCVDINRNCWGWEKHCTSNNYVKKNCKRTCGTC